MSDTDISSDENCSSKQATIQVRVSFKVFKSCLKLNFSNNDLYNHWEVKTKIKLGGNYPTIKMNLKHQTLKV